ncbi:MAG TPA: hypothetical protein VK507_07310 [Iamia sp.]|nr:hypothetical protein [Iamia sp.]
MSHRLIARIGAGIVIAGISLGALSGGPASAKGGDDGRVEKRGACTSGATWKLKGKHDDRRLEVEVEIDSNRVGQTWNVVVTDNGATVFSGARKTLAPSGSFEVERHITDRAGADVIRASATNPATGQRCTGSITV